MLPDVFEATIVHSRSPKAAARAARKAEKIKLKSGNAPPLIAKTPRQRDYLEALWDGENIFAVGPAGSGKTYLPARVAAKALLDQKVEKVIISRVTVSDPKHALGFLPGKLNDKLRPWLIPVIDAIKEEVGAHILDQWTQEGKIEIVSFEHMRGRTFQNAFIILDEAQNASFSDLKLFLTRIGEESQVVITGDLDQIDVKNSGLLKVIHLCRKHSGPMRLVHFTHADVVRSFFTREWVRIFQAESPISENLDELPNFLHTAGMSRNRGG